jgi:23S rRNA (cytidine1920-2'-O)/16S rRNA (cytidine1409-2'-O)-methyltransferase
LGRDRAKALIMSGIVYLNGQRADKAGIPVAANDVLEIRGESMPYVSRGGLKLEKALRCFDLDLNGSVCCDFGASTGGFTDCMLKNGAFGFMPSMWDTVSWRGRCAVIQG